VVGHFREFDSRLSYLSKHNFFLSPDCFELLGLDLEVLSLLYHLPL